MSEFGKRGVRSAATSPSRQRASRASVAPDRAPAAATDLLSSSDLRNIDKGTVPTWINMGGGQLMGFVVVVPLLVLAALGYYGPDVMRDIRYSGTFVEARDLQATDGKCTRYMFLVTLCSASVRTARGQVTHQPSFLMFFRSGDGAELVPVRSKADASAVSIEYAVRDVLFNRTLSLIAGTAFFAWIWWMFVQNLRKGRYKGGPAHEAVLHYVAAKSQAA